MESEERTPATAEAGNTNIRVSINTRVPVMRTKSSAMSVEKTGPIVTSSCCGQTSSSQTSWNDVYYIATWAILGTILRVYVNRLLGLDCESDDAGDFWQASRICLTATGTTSRKGGALFIDLPANILGCFFMGLLSGPDTHVIPWFPANHHLQQHTSWHKGLTTGFCGCLTTFASWNTQMVVMMDGSQAENGSQIGSALLGYAIGIMTAIAAFLWGRVVAKLWRNRTTNNGILVRPSNTFDEDDEEQASTHGRPPERNRNEIKVLGDEEASSSPEPVTMFPETMESSSPMENEDKIASEPLPELPVAEENNENKGVTHDDDDYTEPPFMHLGGSVLSGSTTLLVAALLVGFLYGDASGDHVFYRRMWMACLFTPLGAILRNQLKQWSNESQSIQWGTWTANIVGAMISIFLEAIMIRYLTEGQAETYLGAFLWALQAGFAGSLSTVSTFVKELVDLERWLDRHLYGSVTLLIGMSVGLAIYSPIVRS